MRTGLTDICLFDIPLEDITQAKSQVILASEFVGHSAIKCARSGVSDVETHLLPIKFGSGQRIQFSMTVTFNTSMNGTNGVAGLLMSVTSLLRAYVRVLAD